jgi:DNA-binding transcriptional regulator GbsR (MarR family)
MQQATASFHPIAAEAEGTPRLSAIEAGFIQNWEALARAFGMDPVLGRVHALAFLSTGPVSPELVAETLGLSRQRSAECLTQLQVCGAVRAQQDLSGATYYEADGDPWSWFMMTLKERGRREFGPLVRSIREANARAQQMRRSLTPDALGERHRIDRIARFTEFVEQVASVIETFATLGAGPVMSALRMLSKVRGPRLSRA